jgi:hypothetical protein
MHPSPEAYPLDICTWGAYVRFHGATGKVRLLNGSMAMPSGGARLLYITETNGIHLVQFGMQNRTPVPYLAAINRILISVMVVTGAQGKGWIHTTISLLLDEESTFDFTELRPSSFKHDQPASLPLHPFMQRHDVGSILDPAQGFGFRVAAAPGPNGEL